MIIGEKIRRLRMELQLTQEELADRHLILGDRRRPLGVLWVVLTRKWDAV